MSSPVQERTAGRPDADAVGIDPVGRAAAPPPVQDVTHLPDLASRSLDGCVVHADDVLAGRPAQGPDALPDAVRALLTGGAR